MKLPWLNTAITQNICAVSSWVWLHHFMPKVLYIQEAWGITVTMNKKILYILLLMLAAVELHTAFWGPNYPLRTSCLFQLWTYIKEIFLSLDYYNLNNAVNVVFLSVNLFSKPTWCTFNLYGHFYVGSRKWLQVWTELHVMGMLGEAEWFVQDIC